MNLDTMPMGLDDELERAGDVPAVSDEVLLAARASVRRAATTATLRADVLRARRRRRLRAGLVVALAAASVVVGAVRLDVGGHDVGAPPAAAAAVLERAARATLAQSDPVVGPGQYLKITLVEQSWSGAYGRNGLRKGNDGRWVVGEERRTRSIWVPHDVRADWIVRDGTTVLRRNSADPAYHFAGEPRRTWSQPSWADPEQGSYIQTYDPAWYAALPHDPEHLMPAVRAAIGGEGHGLAYDFQEIYSEVLRSGLAPARVRATLFEGLSRVPGMAVQRGVTTLDGRRGIALGARDSHWQMVFDEQSGRYIGERATDPSFPDVPGLDRDKTTFLTSVTTEVVDQAPRVRPGGHS